MNLSVSINVVCSLHLHLMLCFVATLISSDSELRNGFEAHAHLMLSAHVRGVGGHDIC